MEYLTATDNSLTLFSHSNSSKRIQPRWRVFSTI